MKNEIKEFNFDCLGTPYQYSYGAIYLTENPNQPEMLIELPSSAQRFATSEEQAKKIIESNELNTSTSDPNSNYTLKGKNQGE